MSQSNIEINTNSAPECVDSVLVSGIKSLASDIHIDSVYTEIHIRFRIDGVIIEIAHIKNISAKEFFGTLKIRSSLRTDVSSMPQDGKFRFRYSGEKYCDMRVSIIPSLYGQSGVVRILLPHTSLPVLTALGISESNIETLTALIRQKSGLILVTGPTGSGKTTTLYSLLSHINTQENIVVTLEDPVEYVMNGVRHTQVSRHVGFTFAVGLRSIMRQDPDVILVGEIRDEETARIACDAALTGHLVFATLHTNDSCSAIRRMREMGIPATVLSEIVRIIIAQRLVRTLCSTCKGARCRECVETGFKGRMGLYEILNFSEKIQSLVAKDSSYEAICSAARKTGMVTLEHDGLEKIAQGYTTLAEAERVL